jgi:hypothetical protein
MKKPILTSDSAKQNYYFLISVLIIFIIAYMYILDKYKKHVVDFLSKKNSNYELTYSSVSSGGLFFITNRINNLQIRTLKDNKEYVLKLNNIYVKNLIFTKVFTILLDDKIEMKDFDGEIYILNISKDNNTIIELDSSNKLKNLNAYIQEIYLKYQEDKMSIKNFMVNLIKITTYDDIVNNTAKVSSDSVIFDFKDEDGTTKNYEINFDLLVSSIGEIGSNGKLIGRNTIIEKGILNDISNNFAFNVDGEVKNNILLNSVSIAANLKIINYNSLIRTINSGKYFLINKDYLSSFIEILGLIPQNVKNTASNKFYEIKYNTASKQFTINNIEGVNIIKSLFIKK